MKPTALILTLLLTAATGCGKDDAGGARLFYGKDMKQITTDGGNFPVWSPDGNNIAYVNAGNLWMISPEGGDPVKLTDTAGFELNPAWHPDASNPILVFVTRGTDESLIQTLNVQTQELTEIFSINQDMSYPSFSHDGTRIVYTGASSGYGIRRIPADGSADPVKIENDEGWG